MFRHAIASIHLMFLTYTHMQSEERAAVKMASQKNELALAQLKFIRSYITYLRCVFSICHHFAHLL